MPIPSDEVPEDFRLPGNKRRHVITNVERSLPCAPYITSLCYCVRRCAADSVTIEAWFGWGDCPPEAKRHYLTKEAIGVLI